MSTAPERITSELLSLRVSERRAVLAVRVARTSETTWDVWAPGRCHCQPPSQVGLSLDACAREIAGFRSKSG